jgi:hypothetical protein
LEDIIFAPLKILKNKITMKKVFAILAVAGVMAACNNGENKEVKADTPVVKADSSAIKVDSSAVKVDSAAAKVDSTKK